MTIRAIPTAAVLFTLAILAQAQANRPAAALERSGAKMVVSLRDAAGQPLNADLAQPMQFILWHRVDNWLAAAPAWFDAADSRIVCAGYGDRGLEPGKYVLLCAAGAYGSFTREFEVARGQEQALAHKFDTTGLVITLQFKDSAGRPVAALARDPWWPYESDAVEGPKVPVLTPLLSEGPSTLPARARGGRSTTRNRYLTDDGKWHLPVIAGRQIDLEGPVKLRRKFEAADAARPVELRVEDGMLGNPALPVANEHNPGNVRMARDHPVTVVRFEIRERLLRPELNDATPVSHTGTHWEARIPRGTAPMYRMYGGPLCETEWQPLTEAGADGVITIRHEDRYGSVEVSAESLALRAWWDWCHLVPQGQPAGDPRRTMIGDGRTFTSLVDPARLELIEQSRTLRVVYGGGAGRTRNSLATTIPWPPDNPWQRTRVWESVADLTDQDMDAIRKGRTARLRAGFIGVMFRAVDKNGAGIPYAEAAFILFDEEKTALRLKAKLEELAGKGEPVKLARLLPGHVDDDDVTDETLRGLLGDAVYKAMGSRDLRLRLARHGTWYDIDSTVVADCHGFGLLPPDAIVADAKYAVHFWGGSRNEFKPDLRREFTDREKGVDLGAITLPGYAP